MSSSVSCTLSGEGKVTIEGAALKYCNGKHIIFCKLDNFCNIRSRFFKSVGCTYIQCDYM